MITVRFFAMLKNKVGKEEVKIPLEKEITVEDLKETLRNRFPDIADYLIERRVLISVNQEFAAPDTVLKDGDEVAILPSFSGGIQIYNPFYWF